MFRNARREKVVASILFDQPLREGTEAVVAIGLVVQESGGITRDQAG
jgi:hypothetical protein